MIKANYKSTILKQGYRKDTDDSYHPFFNECMIGVPVAKELYAANEETAYKLIAKWDNDPYYDFEIINVEKIEECEIPRNVFFHDTEFSGSKHYFEDL